MTQQADQDLPSLVKDIMPAIVQIIVPGGQGTGFFIREDGLIMTNKHVVDKHTFVKIRTHDEKEYDGQVFFGNVQTDMALLYTNAPVQKVLSLSDSSRVQVSETIIAIGHPLGFSFTVSEGIVSAIARQDVVPGLKSLGFLQLDLGINPGNSGGPVIRPTGDVIGMVTLAAHKAQDIAFAIPSNHLLDLLKEISGTSKEEFLSRIYCSLCGHPNNKDNKYCGKCGTALKRPERPAGYSDVLKPPVLASNDVPLEGPTITCRVCGATNLASEKYCLKCGAVINGQGCAKTTAAKTSGTEPVTCLICGQKNESAVKYCRKCGHQI